VIDHRARAEKFADECGLCETTREEIDLLALAETYFAEVEAEALREVGQGMGVEFDDERLGYVSVQIDRDAYDKITRTLKGKP
jgi:hypothetical protein